MLRRGLQDFPSPSTPRSASSNKKARKKQPLSNSKRNRELESVQLSQMEKERILSEQKSLHEFLEKKADLPFQGVLAAQTRLSEAQAESDWPTSRIPEDGTVSGKPIV